MFRYSVVELMQSDWVSGSEGEREVEVEIRKKWHSSISCELTITSGDVQKF